MATLCALQLVRLTGVHDNHASSSSVPIRRSEAGLKNELLHVSGLRIAPHHRVGSSLGRQTGCSSLWDHLRVSSRINHHVQSGRLPVLATSVLPSEEQVKKVASMFIDYGAQLIRRTASVVQLCPPLVAQTAPAFGLMVFTIWGLGPTMRFFRKIFRKTDRNWDGSWTRHIMASYMRPILLWIGVIVICRAFDPVVLSTNASQAIKQRFVNFVRSLSTVLAFAFCTASLTQQVQKFMMEHQDTEDSRNVGVQFIGNAVYTSVWVAAVCLFMELLGFSTQKWITAGGFGTVLLTLAGREIFTNFLSSIMIHATRPFVDNEWIQTKIEGQEVSGTVEHVGWWSPTVIRGDDREAVHIPNHKFSVSVVRNLSQKTHWRIKTHFGISHLDVNKLPDIIRDMRRVLSKNPQVEQQRLHRRAFFDTIDPENQALQILISCFVKTSHFEEYLRVKEMILLDLLKVISNHNARLATPIRSVQRVLDESESRGAPFRDVRANAEARRRPFLLMAEAMSDDESEDDKDDTPGEVSRLGADLGKATTVLTSGNIDENGVTMEDLTDLKDPSVINKPKENASVSGENGTTVASSTISALHISVKSVEDSQTTDLDSEEKQAGNDDPTLEPTVATSQTVADEIVIEEPVEAIPYLYSNNVGLDEASHQRGGKTLADSTDDPWKHSSSSHVPASETQPRPPSIAVKPAGDSSTQTDTNVLQKHSEHLKDITSQHVVIPASHPSGADPLLIAKNVVQVGVNTLPADNDDPWKQPPASHVQDTERPQPRSSFVDGTMDTDNIISVAEQGVTEKGNLEHTVAARHAVADHVTEKHVGEGLSLYSDNVLDDKSDGVSAGTSPASSNDPWKEPPALHVQDTERRQPRSSFVDGSMHTENISVQEQGMTGKGTLKHTVAARHAIADHVTEKHVGMGPSLHSDSALDDKSDAASTSPASSDDPWKQTSVSHAQGSEKSVLQARPPVIENNLVVPGVVIKGPKHTLPLDDDSITLGDSRTLVALGKTKNISKEHTTGGVSSDATDRER